MIFGIDVVGIIVDGLPLLPDALFRGVPGILAGIGEWASCIGRSGLTAEVCQYMN
ncbi:hypothetical protein [Skermania piniformis]|uniref:Uncharacterized protein n=1 Tax=Skermania pinensis TaxID=39122 RepID=A0ABX8SA02_9ACTN|nr:hypothetical protein [Skermania piniformis]QXQ14136.1 hypothetical protein KV203_01415 [Skermania piniformis]